MEGVLDDTHEKEPWTDEDDFYFEDCNGTNLVISFGSNGRLRDDENNVPLFDFKGALSELKNFDKLFIRDLRRQYYLNGIKNSAPSIRELQDLIQRYIRSKKYNHVVTIGASSGGFGAILYGNLINADCMIAFNPQTVLDEKKETIIKDNICVSQLANGLQIETYKILLGKCLELKILSPFKAKQ